MTALAAAGTHQEDADTARLTTETEPGRRVDDAIKAYFDRLVERTEVPQHLIDLISGTGSGGDEGIGSPGPA